MELSSALKFAREFRKFTLQNLADKVGVSKQAISQFEKGSSKPKPEVLEKLKQALDFDELVNAKVPLTFSLDSSSIELKGIETVVNTKSLGSINYPLDPADTPFIDLGDGQYVMVVPLVNEYAYAGYLAGFKDHEYIEELPKHTIIVNKQHRGNYQSFEVLGDSMENWESEEMARESIPNGSIVTGRNIPKHYWTSKLHTHRYKDYVIVSKDGILTKRVSNHDVTNGIITLHSLNPNKELYPDREMHLQDVFQIFNVVNVSQTR